MRTRATGQSPGGFHVLTTPKRTRRQPPPPARASRSRAKDPESRKEKTPESCNGTASVITQESPEPNAENHQSILKHNSNINGTKNLATAPSREETHSTSLSDQKSQKIKAHSMKNTDVKRRGGVPKKTQTSRNSSKRLIHQNFVDAPDVNTFEVQASQSCRKTITSQPVKPILGKRHRTISSSNIATSTEETVSLKSKRIHVGSKDFNRLDANSNELSALVPYDYIDRSHTGANQGRISYSKSPHILHDELLKENQPLTATPTKLRSSQDVRQELKNHPKSTKSCRNTPLDSKQKHTTANFSTRTPQDRNNDVEMHIKQGMQSIMSRMNKYQYQPLPKNPYDSTASDIGTEGSSRYNKVEKKQEGSEFLNPPDNDKKRNERIFRGQKQNGDGENGNGNLVKSKKMSHLEKPRDRRMEMEKLFRSTVPDASYQNILRAVAEWAVDNPSILPTKEDIFKYIESSRAPDATELFAAADRPFLRNTPSKMRKSSLMSNSSLKSSKLKVNRERRETDKHQFVHILTPRPSDENPLASRRVAFPDTTEVQPAELDSPDSSGTSGLVKSDEESPTMRSDSKTQASQSWGFLNKFKSIVSTPFKALGFGFGLSDSHESVKDVTKDINFEFKSDPTPKACERQRKSDRPTSKYLTGIHTPSRNIDFVKPMRLQSDQPHRYKTPNKQLNPQRAVTEKRRADLQRELALKKSSRREKEENDDTDRRRKKPLKSLEDIPSYNINDSSIQYHQPNHSVVANKFQIEEWPPNLDPDRPVIELAQASQELPRGPNGEDVATMLCKGWLISKHRDSFVREARESEVVPIRKSIFEPSGLPLTTSSQNLEHSLSKNSEPTETVNAKNSIFKDHCSNDQPGRSYGFEYDDDSSSDEEDTDSGKKSDDSGNKNLNIKKINPEPVGDSLSKTTLSSLGSQITCSSDENKNLSEPTLSSSTISKRLAYPNYPYTPRMPSNLRNMEALSPKLSNLTTPLSLPKPNASASESTDNKSMVPVCKSSQIPQSTCLWADWSPMYRIDPRMAHFDSDMMSAVEAIPKEYFPSIQLPACHV